MIHTICFIPYEIYISDIISFFLGFKHDLVNGSLVLRNQYNGERLRDLPQNDLIQLPTYASTVLVGSIGTSR